jgi:hypothetical protein
MVKEPPNIRIGAPVSREQTPKQHSSHVTRNETGNKIRTVARLKQQALDRQRKLQQGGLRIGCSSQLESVGIVKKHGNLEQEQQVELARQRHTTKEASLASPKNWRGLP